MELFPKQNWLSSDAQIINKDGIFGRESAVFSAFASLLTETTNIPPGFIRPIVRNGLPNHLIPTV